MTNILNTIIASQHIAPSEKKDIKPVFTFDTQGKVKPKEYKGKLLPSRIFGSPIEYAKDLKKDVISIGRAAKGQSGDYELGRINDLAMKLGSLGLAAYLFAKNPLKLSKTMEFVGFGTFFASMALWPKLAIQAPLKARTGVDIHQKYIDSQGRKKMVFQDPQYVLTDLYSKEDLQKMGDKLGVNKNLPDRDNFIKQRAQKTALQGNTLWMMTAGVATPVMSALACNTLEKPLNSLIEKYDLASSSKAINNLDSKGFIAKVKDYFGQKSLEKFLTENADEKINDKLISRLASQIGGKTNSASVQTAIVEELKAIRQNVIIDENFLKATLKDLMPDLSKLSEQQRKMLNEAMNEGSLRTVSDILSSIGHKSKREQKKLSDTFIGLLSKAQQNSQAPKLSDVADKVRGIRTNIADFAAKKSILDKFISARIGDKSGTYIANQWDKVTGKFIKSLKLSSRELQAVSQGNLDVVLQKIAALSANDAQYDKLVQDLMKLIGDYENITGEVFTTTVRNTAEKVCKTASDKMQADGFGKIAQGIFSEAKKGTVENIINVNTAERISGAKSSFYRLIQTLNLFKGINNGTLESGIKKILKENGQNADEATVSKIIEACKKILMNATTTDYVEKLKTSGFNLSQEEYKTVMKVLFNADADKALEKSLKKSLGSEKAKEMLDGFKKYRSEFMQKVANWQNGITVELSRCTVDGVTNGANAVERNNLAGKPIGTMIQDAAKKAYNSKKWLKIFGGTMIALTAVTLIATLFIGKKSRTEKEVEAQQQQNG